MPLPAVVMGLLVCLWEQKACYLAELARVFPAHARAQLEAMYSVMYAHSAFWHYILRSVYAAHALTFAASAGALSE